MIVSKLFLKVSDTTVHFLCFRTAVFNARLTTIRSMILLFFFYLKRYEFDLLIVKINHLNESIFFQQFKMLKMYYS